MNYYSTYIKLLTSFDGGYIHQGCWSWGGDVAGTAGSRDMGCSAKPRAGKHSPFNFLFIREAMEQRVFTMPPFCAVLIGV